MVALLEIDDIITIVRREPTDTDEEAQWQLYIDTISAFINGYIDVSFEALDGDVRRYRADYYGEVYLGGDPISAVNSVKGWRTQEETSWDWDGIDTIFGLCAGETVDVDFDHGYSEVPDDIRFLAGQAVVGAIGLSPSVGTITTLTVGDITEVYDTGASDGATVVILSRAILDRYRITYGTWKLGANPHPGASINPSA